METLAHGPEHQASAEQSAELVEAAQERLEQLKESGEKGTETDPAKKAEMAREIIETQPEPEPGGAKSERSAASGPVTRLDKLLSYKHTMLSLQRQMKPISRSFSKFIHQPVVEKISDVAAVTVLRPSITLGATASAAAFGGFMYLTARHYGYALSGSEFILALLGGALIGLGLELTAKLVRGLVEYFRH